MKIFSDSGLEPLFVSFAILVALKLTHVITWSWLWVTAPLWGPFVVLAVFILCALVVLSVVSIYKLLTLELEL